MSKYLYMVNPRIALKLNGETIRRSKNVELEKEEVKFALKHGPVYRKFNAQVMERVTLQNIDELHVASKDDKKVNKTVDEVKPAEEKTDNLEDAVTPITGFETKEEDITDEKEITVDEIESDSTDNNELVVDTETSEETETVTVSDEVVTDEVVTEENVEVSETTETVTEENVEVTETPEVPVQQNFQNQQGTNNYYRKKRKNRQ